MTSLNILTVQLANHISLIQISTFAGVIITLWIMETLICEKTHKLKLAHAVPNLLFIITGLPVQLSLSLFVLMVSHWSGEKNWGILNHLHLGSHIWLKYLIGFMILDLLDYSYHVMMHKTGILWRFHQVHHGDEHLDVSTTLREHPVETMIRVSFLSLWVFISGATFGLLIIRQIIQTISNILAHTEIKFSGRTERILGLLIITPHIHSIHHHNKLPFTDSNYGDVLCIWDRLFGTYRKMDDAHIQHGLDTNKVSDCTNFIALIKIPFAKINDPTIKK